MNSFTTKYIPDEGNPVIKFERGKFGLEFHINDTPWNADSVQSYELTGDETDQLRRLLGCSGVDIDEDIEEYTYHYHAQYKQFSVRTSFIDGMYTFDQPITTERYNEFKELLIKDNDLDCKPSELIIKSLTRL